MGKRKREKEEEKIHSFSSKSEIPGFDLNPRAAKISWFIPNYEVEEMEKSGGKNQQFVDFLIQSNNSNVCDPYNQLIDPTSKPLQDQFRSSSGQDPQLDFQQYPISQNHEMTPTLNLTNLPFIQKEHDISRYISDHQGFQNQLLQKDHHGYQHQYNPQDAYQYPHDLQYLINSEAESIKNYHETQKSSVYQPRRTNSNPPQVLTPPQTPSNQMKSFNFSFSRSSNLEPQLCDQLSPICSENPVFSEIGSTQSYSLFNENEHKVPNSIFNTTLISSNPFQTTKIQSSQGDFDPSYSQHISVQQNGNPPFSSAVFQSRSSLNSSMQFNDNSSNPSPNVVVRSNSQTQAPSFATYNNKHVPTIPKKRPLSFSADLAENPQFFKDGRHQFQKLPPRFDDINVMKDAEKDGFIRGDYHEGSGRMGQEFDVILESSLNTVRRWSENKVIMEVFYCSICDLPTDSEENLTMHIKRMHTSGRKQEQYSCRACGKLFDKMESMNLHEKSCDIFRPYRCDMCEKKFIFRGRLRVHRRSCGLNSPVPCKVCNKLFINYTNLNHHVVVHAYM